MFAEGSFKDGRILYSKSSNLLHQSRQALIEESFKAIYFFFILSYLNYANIAWNSTNVIKLNKIHLLQKRSLSIM